MSARHSWIAVAIVLCAISAVTAQISPAPALKGLAFTTDDGESALLQVLATSLPLEGYEVAPPPDNPTLEAAAEVGSYQRVEWDKGAFLLDGFSARWTGTLTIAKAGDYIFYATTDDGARLHIDGEAVLEAWEPRPGVTSEAPISLDAGEHEVIMEFYEGGGGAIARLEWSAEGLERQVVPAEVVSSDGEPGWTVEYFTNTDLADDAIGTEHVATIDNDWGEGGIRVGAEEPGHVAFDWTPLSESTIFGRVNAGPETQIGLALPHGVSVRFLDPTDDADITPLAGVVWRPPTEGSVVFIAGVSELSDLATATEARTTINAAYEASVSPNLPPYPADDEGWVALLDGESKDGWKMRSPDRDNWVAGDSVLDNQGHGGSDIITEWTFQDADLHIEFTYPAGSNSGVYLQGRYEIQVLDSFGSEIWGGMCGAIYHIADPTSNPTKPAGEWQSFDAEFTSAGLDEHGRSTPARMTVRHNDVLTIEDAEIPRATGGELDRDYLSPGPIMLQGDHGPVTYRNIKIRPR